VFALMVVIIGGRIVPSFTRNVLMRRGAGTPLPEQNPYVDRLAIVSAALLALAVMVQAPAAVTAALAIIAAAANAVRLARWRGLSVLGEPILWSLHLAYAFLVVGFAALAADRLFDLGSLSGEHLIAIGAVGGMTLAVMTRAALGHTGRALRVKPAIALAYGLVAVAAIVRAFGPALLTDWYFAAIFLAGGLWIAAFALFVAVYLPILTGPSRTS